MKTSYIGVYDGIATNPDGKSMACWSVYLHIPKTKLLRLFFYRREELGAWEKARAEAEKFARRSRAARGLPQPQGGE